MAQPTIHPQNADAPAEPQPNGDALTWLDRLPRRIALAGGIAVGLGVGWGIWLLPAALAVPLFLLALVGGLALAFQGWPVLADHLPRPHRARERSGLAAEDWCQAPALRVPELGPACWPVPVRRVPLRSRRRRAVFFGIQATIARLSPW